MKSWEWNVENEMETRKEKRRRRGRGTVFLRLQHYRRGHREHKAPQNVGHLGGEIRGVDHLGFQRNVLWNVVPANESHAERWLWTSATLSPVVFWWERFHVRKAKSYCTQGTAHWKWAVEKPWVLQYWGAQMQYQGRINGRIIHGLNSRPKPARVNQSEVFSVICWKHPKVQRMAYNRRQKMWNGLSVKPLRHQSRTINLCLA